MSLRENSVKIEYTKWRCKEKDPEQILLSKEKTDVFPEPTGKKS